MTVGKNAETLACKHLEDHGLRLITRNYRSRSGEIDLIMSDAELLVFVEVRFRSQSGYGNGIESVTRPKQKKIIACALHYIQSHGDFYDCAVRFDVVGVSPGRCHDNPEFQWVKNAFGE